MKLVTLDSSTLSNYTVDPEMLQKAKRPCVLVIRLKYKGSRYDFAVPLRSNISPSAPKNQYFPLPPNASTKSKHRHGIHYIKMFPVDRRKLLRFRTSGNAYATLVRSIINNNEKQIIQECQNYLTSYEQGIRPLFATDIDLLLKQI